MLRIRQLKHLAVHLGVTERKLDAIAESPARWCQKLQLFDPAKPNKIRQVLNVTGPLRRIQTCLLRSVLLPRLSISRYSHGGVQGRHVKTNVAPHLKSTFVFTTDISNFYPSIGHRRVYRLFCDKFECAPDVARICTKVCTHDYHLALGLITSPILADQILQPIDLRIGQACEKAELVYTRYVDDIAISGNFDFASSGIPGLVHSVLEEHGFYEKDAKRDSGYLKDEKLITKLRIKRGHPDASRAYIRELERQLEDARKLAKNGEFDGPYFTKGQIRGRIEFVAWINPGRRRNLMHRFKSISWKNVERNAAERSLIASSKKTLSVKETTE